MQGIYLHTLVVNQIKMNILKNIIRKIVKKTIPEFIQLQFTINKPYQGLLKLIPLHTQFQKNSIREVNREGIRYRFDISDIVSWWNYYGFKEKEQVNLMEKIDKKMVVFDIGANIGTFSLPFGKKVGNEGTIYSFEPFLPTFKKLQHNLSLNEVSIKNVKIFNLGIGKEAGTFKFELRDANNYGMNRVSKNGEFEVNITTLDKFISDIQLQKIDWIKIDVEGFEYEVILGAKNLIKQFRPNFFIEINDENLRDQNSSAKDVILFFEQENFNIFSALDFKPITSNDNFENCHLDIFCLK